MCVVFSIVSKINEYFRKSLQLIHHEFSSSARSVTVPSRATAVDNVCIFPKINKKTFSTSFTECLGEQYTHSNAYSWLFLWSFFVSSLNITRGQAECDLPFCAGRVIPGGINALFLILLSMTTRKYNANINRQFNVYHYLDCFLM